MTALVATALDYSLAGAGPHSGAKTMLAFASANVGLISAFHYIDVRIGGLRWALGYEPVAATSKGPWWS
jgi:hypothetical protein